MKKSLTTLALAVALMGLLSGCCIKHEYSEATCTEPQTCVKCGETLGEALGHDYSEATCTEDSVCSRCGDVAQKALGHTPDIEKANYQQASTCTVCGEVLEEKLTPGFEEKGIKIDTDKLNTEVAYRTTCYDDSTLYTVGTFCVSDFEVLDGDDILTKEDGYKWVRYHMHIEVDDENAQNYGISWNYNTENYYDPKGFDDSATDVAEDDPFSEYGGRYYTVNYNGIDYDKCLSLLDPSVENAYTYGWNSDNVFMADIYYAIRLPEGFDGLVVGARNHEYAYEDGTYIYDFDFEEDEDFACVRLPAAK